MEDDVDEEKPSINQNVKTVSGYRFAVALNIYMANTDRGRESGRPIIFCQPTQSIDNRLGVELVLPVYHTITILCLNCRALCSCGIPFRGTLILFRALVQSDSRLTLSPMSITTQEDMVFMAPV